MIILATALVLGASAQKPTGPVTVTAGPTIDNFHPIAYAPAPTGSKFVACMEDGSVRIIDSKTRQTVKILAKHPQPAYAVAWSTDGAFIATGDETARIWIESAVSGQKIREYRTHARGIQKLSFNITRQYLISTGKDDVINIYNLASSSPKEAVRIAGRGMDFYGAVCHPKLPYTLTTGSIKQGACTYDCNTGKCTGFLTTSNELGVNDVAYSLNGTREVTCERNYNAYLWDSKSLKKLGTLAGHQESVMCAAFSPNGGLIATSSVDHTVKIWNSYSCQNISTLPSQAYVGSPLCFTADGNSLMSVNDQGFLQFNTVSPNQAAMEDAPKPSLVIHKPKKRRHKSN